MQSQSKLSLSSLNRFLELKTVSCCRAGRLDLLQKAMILGQKTD